MNTVVAERRGAGDAVQRGAPLKVLYVVSLFPCWSETFIVREIHALLRRGIDVRIVSLRPPSESMVQTDAEALLPRVFYPASAGANTVRSLASLASAPLRELGALGQMATHLASYPPILAKSLGTWWRLAGLEARIREWAPDHIHAHFATYPSTAAMVLAKRLGVPFSFTAHAHDIFLEDQLLAAKLARATFSIGISRFNRAFLDERIGAGASNGMRVVHCGIELPRFPFLPDGRDARRILAVGRLDHIKGFEHLVDACALLKERNIDFACDIIGTGILQERIAGAISRHGLQDHVHLLGAQKQEAVQQHLRHVAIFAMPSVVTPRGDRDGIPVALMEAMASGARVVSTRVSGIPELVEHEVTGLLAEPADAASLAAALQRLLQDPALGERLTRAARLRIETEFDIVREAGKLAAAIQQGLADTGAGAGR
jgi:glycosyltransferase involved in cell wall biosynthesis